ncbi:unnamed protein product [Ranitomeya imitator]|uniref:Uncharacterized protein n=1 Tax=Ranitomeya imitator TaxID=111125 RepID=A0ABN9LUF5_9NEOB|nr:unnamed protein product [Ranitomeya imitator]
MDLDKLETWAERWQMRFNNDKIWYFGSLTKLDAKRYLLQEENGTGSFVVWQKVADDCYYISGR